MRAPSPPRTTKNLFVFSCLAPTALAVRPMSRQTRDHTPKKRFRVCGVGSQAGGPWNFPYQGLVCMKRSQKIDRCRKGLHHQNPPCKYPPTGKVTKDGYAEQSWSTPAKGRYIVSAEHIQGWHAVLLCKATSALELLLVRLHFVLFCSWGDIEHV